MYLKYFKQYIMQIYFIFDAAVVGGLFAHLAPALFFRRCLVIFSVIITDMMGHFQFLHGLRMNFFLLNILEKLQWKHLSEKLRERDSSPSSLLIRYNIYAFWKTESTIQANRDHHHFFIHIPRLYLAEFLSILSTKPMFWLQQWN